VPPLQPCPPTDTDPAQKFPDSLHSPFWSMKHLHEGAHTVQARCISENMQICKYERMKEKRGKDENNKKEKAKFDKSISTCIFCLSFLGLNK
jgi:formate hydrogenlyase subunit 6/NADH:ubiquinone oxidoreductase subunit I